MHVHVKICGFTEPLGLNAAIDAGVDSIGLVLDPSPRQLSLDQAVELAKHVPSHVELIAVCGRPPVSEVAEIAHRLKPKFIQLMADSIPDPSHGFSILPAFEDGPDLLARVEVYCEQHDDERPLVLADGPRPGSGITADWARVKQLSASTRLMLAGGLTPENVGDAIARMKPFGVDVSSGVERERGLKDPDLIRAFVAAVRLSQDRLRESK
jgi:phosphoribosylanthranilate isomerase